MNEKIFFEWSNDTIITTIVFTVIIVFSLLYLYLQFKNTDSRLTKFGAVAIALFLVIVDVHLNSMIPVYATYTESEIRIKQIVGSKRIAYSAAAGDHKRLFFQGCARDWQGCQRACRVRRERSVAFGGCLSPRKHSAFTRFAVCTRPATRRRSHSSFSRVAGGSHARKPL